MQNTNNQNTKATIRTAAAEDNLISNYSTEIQDFFIDSKTGTLKAELSVTMEFCPACAKKENKLFMQKNGFTLLQCDNCQFLYVNPRPKEESIAEFFKGSHAIDTYSDMVEKTKENRKKLIFDSLYNTVSKLKPEGGSLVEVGCGPGLLLEVMKEKATNWKVQGVETNARAVEICQGKGLDVFFGSLEQFNSGNFDVVVFWAVWDHFADPEKYMQKTFNLLKPGGCVVIGNLNSEGFDSLILGKDNPAFTLPERMNFFNIKSFSALLERSGFKQIDIKTTGKLDVSIVNEYWTNGGKEGRNVFLEKIIFGSDELKKEFQEFLSAHQLSSHMTVIAQK